MLLASLALAVSLVAVPANARRGNPYASAEVAKHRHGPWSGVPIEVTIPTGKQKTLFMRITNITSGPRHVLHMKLFEDTDGGPPSYHQTWFARHEDISHEVRASGYHFDLKPDATRRFRIRVKANDGSVQECLFAHFHLKPEDLDMFPGYFINGNDPCAV